MENLTIQENAFKKWERLNEIQHRVREIEAQKDALKRCLSGGTKPGHFALILKDSSNSYNGIFEAYTENTTEAIKQILIATAESLLAELDREQTELKNEFTTLLN